MSETLLPSAIMIWFLFIPIAITNGVIREKLYKAKLGNLRAHQVSTITASLAFIFLAYILLWKNVISASNHELLWIGLAWVTMTIGFEFGFGHFVDQASWEKLLADYNLLKGRVWGIFLLVILVTPFIVKLLHSKF